MRAFGKIEFAIDESLLHGLLWVCSIHNQVCCRMI